jgi:hypothetical protein
MADDGNVGILASANQARRHFFCATGGWQREPMRSPRRAGERRIVEVSDPSGEMSTSLAQSVSSSVPFRAAISALLAQQASLP